MIKEMGWFLKLILPKWVSAITLAPFGIYMKEGTHADVAWHERIHWQQQTEMLYIFFYLWYVIEWTIKLFKYKRQAYMNISFEREAYAMPENRKPYNWIKYL